VTLAGLEPLTPGRPRFASVLMLYLVRLRRRWVPELMAALGIAAGVALLYAASVASTSLSAPVRALNEGIVGHSQWQLVARGGTTMSDDTYDRIVALPGVLRAAPVLQVPGNLAGPRGETGLTLFGADPRVVRLRGRLLQGFTSTDAARQQALVVPTSVARKIGVKFGDDARVQIAGRALTLPLVVAGQEQIGALADTSVALVPLKYLQRLAHIGPRVSRILVEAKPGRIGEVREGLQRIGGTRLDVRTADYESRLFDTAAKPTDQATLAFSVLSALVGWMFAACALLVTAGDRRKMANQQRLQGVRPRARLVTLLVDAGAVGIVGTLLGLAAGEALSRLGYSSDVSFLAGAFPVGDRRIVTWQCVAIASIGGLLAATIGVLAPVREVVLATLPRALRKAEHPTDDADQPHHGPMVWASGACLAAAVLILIAAPSAVIAGLVLLGLALIMLLPATLAATISGLAALSRRANSPSSALELALQHLKTQRWRPRALAITATGAVAIFGATALQGARQNLQTGLDQITVLTAPPGVWATPPGAGSTLGTTAFQPRDTKALADLPGVSDLSLYRSDLLDIAGHRAWVLGQPENVRDPVPPKQIVEGDITNSRRRLHDGGWATVSGALASDLHVRVGQRFTLASPNPMALRVAAITTNLGWSSGALVMNAADMQRAWGGDAISGYHARLAPGVTPAEGRREITAALSPRGALHVETAMQRADRQRAVSRAGLARLRQITLLTLVAAVLAMGAAMTGLLWQHRTLIANLKIHGPRTAMMWRMLLIETSVLFSTGAILGALFGLLGQVLGTKGVQVVTDFPVVIALRPEIAIATVGLVVGSALLVVAIPGYLVARVRPSWRH
jgi:putative ABC transport system permease protein